EQYGLMTFLLAAIGFVIVFPFPKLAVAFVIVFAQFQYLFTGRFGTLISLPVLPVFFQWLDDIVLLALLLNLVFTKLIKGRDEPMEKAPGLLPLGLLFGVGLMSARLNGVSFINGLIGQRYVFEMVVLYLAIINLDFDERYLRGVVYLLLGIGVFQAFMGLIEFVDRYHMYAAGNHDIVQGTWGGGSANNLGIFFLCLAAIVLARMREGWILRRPALLGVFVALVVLTSSRTAIVLMPLVFLFVFREKLKNPRYWLAIGAPLVFLAGSLLLYYRNTQAKASRDLGAAEFEFQVASRTGVIPLLSQVLRYNSSFPLFGAGPSTYLTEFGRRQSSEFYMEVERLAVTRQVSPAFIQASYAVLWMEYGIVGLVLFLIVLWQLFRFACKEEKRAQSPFWKDYFRALQAILIIYILVGGVFAIWTQFQMNVYLWLFPALGVRYVVLQRRKAARMTAQLPKSTEETSPRRLPVQGDGVRGPTADERRWPRRKGTEFGI
ncbi:MAG: O-antigen ligase family protein, partial [bacterium]|nr:O-antigen ligase family protein [bacterium]